MKSWRLLSASMRSYWAAFARDGRPGRGRDGSLPEWRPWDPDVDKYVVLDTEAGGGIRMDSRVETPDAIAAEILADPSYRDDGERCLALAVLADEVRLSMGEAGFRRAANGRCRSYAYQALLDARWE